MSVSSRDIGWRQRFATYHNRDARVVGDLGDGLELGHVVARVTDALDVDSLGLVVDGGRDGLGAVAVDELGRDAEAGEEHLELVVRAAVEVGCRDDVVAAVGKRRDGHELRGLTGGGSHRSDTALESSDSLLKDIDRGAEGVSFADHYLAAHVVSLRTHFMIRE
jgi:hypothetical protein